MTLTGLCSLVVPNNTSYSGFYFIWCYDKVLLDIKIFMVFSTCPRKFKQSHFFFHRKGKSAYLFGCEQTSLSNIKYLFFYLSLCAETTTPSVSYNGKRLIHILRHLNNILVGSRRIYAISFLGRYHNGASVGECMIDLGEISRKECGKEWPLSPYWRQCIVIQ